MTVPSFRNPLPDLILGDPFVLRWRGRFYLYGTNDGPPLPDGRQIPVFRSDDLLHWQPLGGALIPNEPHSDHWAPEVLTWNGLFFMVVSFGDVDQKGHALWVAVADRPEGPFRLEKQISAPAEKFSIDGSWLVDDDGSLYLFRCLDFTDEPPFGTGIVVQAMSDPMTPVGAPRTVLRAHSPWQRFESNRLMPLYGGRRFDEWTTIEGPAPVKRNGRYYCGYSGGNYTGAYGTGECVADSPLGPYTDLRGQEGPIFATRAGLVDGPGHFSVVSSDGIHDWIVLHGRRPGEGGRRVWLCPVEWNENGVTIGELTDQQQHAPRLPEDSWRAGAGFRSGVWGLASGSWEEVDDGILLRESDRISPNGAVFWHHNLEVGPSFVTEVAIRFPSESNEAAAGWIFQHRHGEFTRVLIDPLAGVCRVEIDGKDPQVSSLPQLGKDRFEPIRFHAIQLRSRAEEFEVRIDGVLLHHGLRFEDTPRQVGLCVRSTSGEVAASAIFDGWSFSRDA